MPTVIRDYKVKKVIPNSAEYQGDPLHKISFIKPDQTEYIAFEKNGKTSSDFVEGKFVPFIIKAPGKSGRLDWIKKDDESEIKDEVDITSEFSDRELAWISVEATKMALMTIGDNPNVFKSDDIPDLAKRTARMIIDTMRSIKRY